MWALRREPGRAAAEVRLDQRLPWACVWALRREPPSFMNQDRPSICSGGKRVCGPCAASLGARLPRCDSIKGSKAPMGSELYESR